ncbi:TetR family transcriptional regulator [Paraperlucidibaca baekdonensis]|uniref:TetR family transcriptional regulator n=1 Tax=Paraperlucidibaca baekdonensis TaxID=748120 RepID=A0A3E0H926_9GAMM|nr:TetR/AcrR family transcriptional regulator [Paraperlucidibaca baekdonensis]REH40163.1 TetR family transcriptional regulator [Paraperlucidibaca baekdonensis]
MTVQSEKKEAQRRTQGERSEAMRQRLIDATVTCLADEGYAGTTVSKIISAAGVSRGAPMHHFPTKASLLEATAEHLIRWMNRHLARATRGVVDSEQRAADMITATWRELHDGAESLALMELMLASRRDEDLARVMRTLWDAGRQALDMAAKHYFEPEVEGIKPTQLFILTHWLMRGMALERHLTNDEQVSTHFIALWAQVTSQHLRAKPGVSTPPPRPAFWNRSLAEGSD